MSGIAEVSPDSYVVAVSSSSGIGTYSPSSEYRMYAVSALKDGFEIRLLQSLPLHRNSFPRAEILTLKLERPTSTRQHHPLARDFPIPEF